MENQLPIDENKDKKIPMTINKEWEVIAQKGEQISSFLLQCIDEQYKNNPYDNRTIFFGGKNIRK